MCMIYSINPSEEMGRSFSGISARSPFVLADHVVPWLYSICAPLLHVTSNDSKKEQAYTTFWSPYLC